MSAVVQICFEHTWSEEALHDGAREFALNVKPEIPGLIWKIFLKDSVKPQSCGIYLFDTMESAQAYAEGARVAEMRSSPELSGISVRVSEVMDAESILAGAPLAQER
ncbi:MAG: YdhR family protein [Proteobacteria bacterium]|nr:YdhR family protein [Pseudomonadota bacterium]